MNRLVMLFLLLISTRAFAIDELSRADLKEKLKFQTETFVTSLNGKVLKNVVGGWSETEAPDGKDRFSGSVVVVQPEGMKPLFAEVNIEIMPDLEIRVDLEQWAKVSISKDHGPKFSNSLLKASQSIVNLGSVQFAIPVSATAQYIVRVIPLMNRKPTPRQLDHMPMSVTDVLAIDNTGKIWGQNSSANGDVVCISGRYGSVYFSFAPFAGSAPMGTAHENDIELKLEKTNRLHIRSAKAVMGAGYAAIVHARIETSEKQPHGGISSMDTKEVERFIKNFSKDW